MPRTDDAACEALGWKRADNAATGPENVAGLVARAARAPDELGVWVEDRPGAILALGGLIAATSPELAAKLKLTAASATRSPPGHGPALAEIEGWPDARGRGEVQIGPRKLKIKGRKTKQGTIARWVVVGREEIVGPVARDAGFEWSAKLEVWSTSELVRAAALGAYADEETAAALERAGVPLGMHRWLRFAPILLPWQRTQWVIVAAQKGRTWFAKPEHGHWRGRGRHPGWASEDSTSAWAMARFAPRPLRAALEGAARENVLSRLRPGTRALCEPMSQGALPRSTATPPVR